MTDTEPQAENLHPTLEEEREMGRRPPASATDVNPSQRQVTALPSYKCTYVFKAHAGDAARGCEGKDGG